MKTHKAILRKINEWEGNPLMVAGIYRLFVYLPWEYIPEKYKEFFPKEAKETWNNDLAEINSVQIKKDIEAEIRAILNTLAKKNVTNSLGLVPMILADVFIVGETVGALQGKLFKIINTYKKNIELDINLAEQLAIIELFDLFEDIIKKTNLELSFDIHLAFDQVLKTISKIEEETQTFLSKDVTMQVDQALKTYTENVKENDK